MKNPNGYGGVSKLPGNRRKPYRVRLPAGWQSYTIGFAAVAGQFAYAAVTVRIFHSIPPFYLS